LHALPFANKEAILIGRLTKGKVVLAQDATEEEFISEAGNFDILHLATHTIIDDNNPLYSMLVFYDTNYASNKGLLTTNEIFGLKLNASMTVLSSCSSGEGEYQKGEGVLSLARGFFYAGCPSLIMTLWKIEDESGLKLMNYYYKYLIKGYSKSRALQKAKLKYLKTVPNEKKHPFYWSAYICIGNPSPIYYSKSLFFTTVVAFVLLSAIIIKKLQRNKRKKQKGFKLPPL
jgi:CHAT domain-containing protein